MSAARRANSPTVHSFPQRGERGSIVVLTTNQETLIPSDLYIIQELDSSDIEKWGRGFVKEYGIIDIELLEDFWREGVGEYMIHFDSEENKTKYINKFNISTP